MNKTLSVSCVQYDRVAALRDGRVSVDGYGLDFRDMPVPKIHAACFDRRELALAEVSPANLAVAMDNGNNDYVGLPVFLSRAFRHGSILVADDGPVGKPHDLARIGVPDWLGTTSIWQRGILQDQYGLDLRQVEWVFAPVDPGGAYKQPSEAVSENFRVADRGAGTSLSELLIGGEIDAILALRPPKAFGAGITRLFPDYVDREVGYFRETGIFPVMHVLVADRAYVEADPELAGRVCAAFLEARDIALRNLSEQAYYFATLPWLPHHVEFTTRVLGEDFWKYGIEDGRAPVETFLRYCEEQSVTAGRIPVEAFFPYS